jgi:hypothetical protein
VIDAWSASHSEGYDPFSHGQRLHGITSSLCTNVGTEHARRIWKANQRLESQRGGNHSEKAAEKAAIDFRGAWETPLQEVAEMQSRRPGKCSKGRGSASSDSASRHMGIAIHAPVETWLGKPLCARPSLDLMVYRYLAVFGPATVRDVQAWPGLTGLRPLLESMRKNLITFLDEEKDELFDLPDAPRPGADSLAPPRFLPVFDNALLSHADRRRIVSETHRKTLFGTAALLEGSVLIDGFVGAKWKISQVAARAVLTIAPLLRLRNSDRAAISEEGTRLLTFAFPAFREQEIQFAKADY